MEAAKYSFNGKESRISLGVYSETTLRASRELRDTESRVISTTANSGHCSYRPPYNFGIQAWKSCVCRERNANVVTSQFTSPAAVRAQVVSETE
jgi:hypothetical protein